MLDNSRDCVAWSLHQKRKAIHPDPDLDARIDRVVALMPIIAATDDADPESITIARRAYRLVCNEIGADAAGIVLADLPREAVLAVTTVPALTA